MQEVNEKDLSKKEKVEPSDQLIHVRPVQHCAKGDHYFGYVSGTEVLCQKCKTVGYPIGAGTEVKNGHIYIHGTLVI